MKYKKNPRLFAAKRPAFLILLFSGLLVLSGGLYGQTLEVEGREIYMDGERIPMWGVRAASASQNEEYAGKLISALDDYKQYGANSVSVYIQGSSGGFSDPFSADGRAIKGDHLNRLVRIIEACEKRSMVVIVGIFYQRTLAGYDSARKLNGRRAVYNAVETTARELKPYGNVIINIANEQNSNKYKGFEAADIRDPQTIISLCKRAKKTDPERIVGAGGYHDSSNVVIGKSKWVDVLLFDTYSGDISAGHHSGWHYDYFLEMGVPVKPMINVELFGGWTRKFVPPGVYTMEGKKIHFREIEESVNRDGLYVHFHSNPWIQGPSDGFPTRYQLGGMGTEDDPGIRWWFEHLSDITGNEMPIHSCSTEGGSHSAYSKEETRDPLKWPFSSHSIWNMPVGSEAVYVHAGIQRAKERGMTVDEDVIVLTPDEELVGIYRNNARWDRNKDRCVVEGGLLFSAPIPEDFVVSPETWDGRTPNSGLAVLMPDGKTIRQTQPFAHCRPGDTATSRFLFDDQDLYGEGIYGAHGGSRLSAIGGALRLGELVPGAGPIRHVLKVNLDSRYNLYYDDETEGFRWPALTADGGASHTYGSLRTVPPVKEARMGALLALPPWMDLDSLGFETEPARIMAEAFRDYGAYVVDGTGWTVYALITEWSPGGRVLDEFEEAWGFSLKEREKDTPWGRDMDRIFLNLHVIDNNGPDSIGGGGTPRAPLAPELKKPAR